VKWPPLEFGHLYVYLIDTPGEFTHKKLKAYKALRPTITMPGIFHTVSNHIDIARERTLSLF